MSDPAQIREALDNLDKHGVYSALSDSLATVIDAAREFADWLETGPDYEAATKLYADWNGVDWKGMDDELEACRNQVTRIVDAALRSRE